MIKVVEHVVDIQKIMVGYETMVKKEQVKVNVKLMDKVIEIMGEDLND